MSLYVHAVTDVGRERAVNEDSHAALPLGADGWMLLVCDGMGGHEGGRLASSTAVDAIAGLLAKSWDPTPPAAIFDALQRANDAVITTAGAQGVPSAGSTAVVALVSANRYWMGWVGDSRIYHFRGRDVVDRSHDHTRVAEMVERGILTPAEAKGHPDAHILSSALGAGKARGEPFKVSAIQETLELAWGDVLVLCSDGLYDLVEDAEIPEILAGRDVTEGAERLVALANNRGGHDNITVVVACWGTRVVPALGAPVTTATSAALAAPIPERSTHDPLRARITDPGLPAEQDLRSDASVADAPPDPRPPAPSAPPAPREQRMDAPTLPLPDPAAADRRADPYQADGDRRTDAYGAAPSSGARVASAAASPYARPAPSGARRPAAAPVASRLVDIAIGLLVGLILGLVIGYFLPRLRPGEATAVRPAGASTPSEPTAKHAARKDPDPASADPASADPASADPAAADPAAVDPASAPAATLPTTVLPAATPPGGTPPAAKTPSGASTPDGTAAPSR